MIWVRSALFLALGSLWTSVLALLYLPLLLGTRRVMQRAAAFWCRGLIALVGICCGLRWRVIGRENLPDGPTVFAAKHQSAWETLIFHVLLEDPVFVLKRELLRVPLVGWYMRKAGGIPIEREAGVRAIRTMLPRVQRGAGGRRAGDRLSGGDADASRTAPALPPRHRRHLCARPGVDRAGCAQLGTVLGSPPLPEDTRRDHPGDPAADAIGVGAPGVHA